MMGRTMSATSRLLAWCQDSRRVVVQCDEVLDGIAAVDRFVLFDRWAEGVEQSLQERPYWVSNGLRRLAARQSCERVQLAD